MATKIIILTGPTGVGKTKQGLAIARLLGSPVINCDSRQIYKELRIGVARPAPAELALVKHYFIASHSIHQPYSAGDYEREAWDLVMSLAPTHPYLLLVGGSGLYIDAFVKGIDLMPLPDPELRKELILMAEDPGGLETLRARLKELDPVTYARIDLANKRRIMRAVEVCMLSGKPYHTFLSHTNRERPFEIEQLLMDRPRPELYERIDKRVIGMMEEGLPEEARGLYPYRKLPALRTVGYRELFDHFEGKYPLEEAVRLIQRNTRRYAKRQLTYWRNVPRKEDHPLLRPDPSL
ncbi:MAG: tRNA (adenosine(37)-N6)-dimethylallyltransferase MiaA [Bacteroidales bacterium]|jgi:tRNA dimethylallyltransferase|nr:tRNA (adenosine(37)-N6)-dimethylallyltransferase MiaA [Bacteroidales bacterium]MDD2263919.1 tRNA (adenosine(37)-N6)-dimethylallyltransferase MiaA [Bacteroidales bacterium]MDD2831153.1 tRNA (adenosine(37)-N6)-dimethylallyltransferase MiaA [Bacteroidales bacterium]MDD3209264.1 tRNA (adenosine(37)-N6)-dimethylallyltransferase MiaA [Bacteroidales bacterium]MDD3697609.1 tRNA (adenosine(37)-N6)-dimethylallyltransferase MiaA [Bacteroidales bacterium]